MDNKEFARCIEDRTKKLAVKILKLSISLPETVEGRAIRNQLTKSATSIGANYREANRSRSKADFYNRIKICESETSESVYWIEIISELEWAERSILDHLLIELNELLAIFAKTSKTLKVERE